MRDLASARRRMLRSLLPTAHRLLLDRLLREELPGLSGDILVLGAGHDPYGAVLSRSARPWRTDVAWTGGVDQLADAHELPFGEATYDAAVALEVFEHLERPAVAAAELRRVLKPGGRAVVSLPFMFRVHGDPGDFTRFTAQGLQALFAGFSSAEVLPFGGRAHVISDILTTAWRPLATLRLLNHLLTPLATTLGDSDDCPSGYLVRLTR